MTKDVAAIAIGRNEGDRLKRCLASLEGQVARVLYVDSGSTDGSVQAAEAVGAEVVELDLSVPFTAARARNAGLARLREIAPEIEFVQFLDGDCALDPHWINTAKEALMADPGLAGVCGRRRELFPQASRWNRLIDAEWDTPIGEAKASGGDVLFRIQALDDVEGYRISLIAGEEPEMCYRMRQLGWRIRRIDAEMTLHDADLQRMSQWWQRNRRAGYAYAESAALHGHEEERFCVKETRRALVWAGLLFGPILLAALVSLYALALLLVWPAQWVRLKMSGLSWERSGFLLLGKLPEAQGVLDYWLARMKGQRKGLIEYK